MSGDDICAETEFGETMNNYLINYVCNNFDQVAGGKTLPNTCGWEETPGEKDSEYSILSNLLSGIFRADAGANALKGANTLPLLDSESAIDILYSIGADIYPYIDSSVDIYCTAFPNSKDVYKMSLAVKYSAESMQNLLFDEIAPAISGMENPETAIEELQSYSAILESMFVVGADSPNNKIAMTWLIFAQHADAQHEDADADKHRTHKYKIFMLPPLINVFDVLFYTEKGVMKIIKNSKKFLVQQKSLTKFDIFTELYCESSWLRHQTLDRISESKELLETMMKKFLSVQWGANVSNASANAPGWVAGLCLNEKFSDVKIYCGGDKKLIYAHKVVLASKSEFFSKLIFSETRLREVLSNDGFHIEISLPNFSEGTMCAILEYIYTGAVYFEGIDDIYEFIMAVQFFCLDELKNFIKKNMLE